MRVSKSGITRASDTPSAPLAMPSVPGATNAWQPYGNTALISDDPQYTAVGGEGFGNLSGRAQGLTYDPADRRHWFVGVSYGGVHYTKYDYPGLYTSADFHHHPGDCPSADGGIDDFNNYLQVTKCELVRLSDLRTESPRQPKPRHLFEETS